MAKEFNEKGRNSDGKRPRKTSNNEAGRKEDNPRSSGRGFGRSNDDRKQNPRNSGGNFRRFGNSTGRRDDERGDKPRFSDKGRDSRERGSYDKPRYNDRNSSGSQRDGESRGGRSEYRGNSERGENPRDIRGFKDRRSDSRDGRPDFKGRDDRKGGNSRDGRSSFRGRDGESGRSEFRGGNNRGRGLREDKPRFNDRGREKDHERDEKPVFRKFGNRSDAGNDRQVGMSKPPRYDEASLRKKAPPRIKDKIGDSDKYDKEDIRLNKYIANAGLCSRREADELIASGMIKVNGKVVTEMGYKVKDSDTIKYGKDVLSRERMMYILLNKPKDFITTMDDPEDRKTVMDLVSGACRERVYPVGRLDRNTTGLLLLTNDGELTEKLTHPSSNIKKIYQAEIDKPFTEEHFEQLKNGIELEDGFIKPDQLAYVTPDAEVIGIEIHSGKNRVVRRIFEHLGYEVTKLDRTTFAGLTKKDLPRGKWRFLTEKEVILLKYLV